MIACHGLRCALPTGAAGQQRPRARPRPLPLPGTYRGGASCASQLSSALSDPCLHVPGVLWWAGCCRRTVDGWRQENNNVVGLSTHTQLPGSPASPAHQPTNQPTNQPAICCMQGFRDSGIGSQGVHHSLEFMCKTKVGGLRGLEGSAGRVGWLVWCGVVVGWWEGVYGECHSSGVPAGWA